MRSISFAPMEGVTTATYRRVHRRHFSGIEKYYSPFIVASETRSFRRREKREFFPYEEGLVPQILTAKAEDLIWAARKLASVGYSEVNLNLGCPSSTVVNKRKGAGLLRDKDDLKRFFDEVFDAEDIPGISIKTRIGYEDKSEAAELARIFSAYPFSEIIIHPRLRDDFYEGEPDMEAFELIKDQAAKGVLICYNGDIWDAAAFDRFSCLQPDVERVMIGRGLIADPSMAEELTGSTPEAKAPALDGESVSEHSKRKRIYDFLCDLQQEYSSELSGERDVLFRLKEIWSYMGRKFTDEKALKVIRKTGSLAEYSISVRKILN